MSDDPTKTTEPPAYTPPATQADLDRIIADRLSREKAKYADYGDLKAKAAKFDEAEQANKTELQKALDRAAAAEAKVTSYETRDQVTTWAKEIVKDSKVPADALRGSTKEELQAHFDQLKALVPSDEEKPTPKGLIGPYVPAEGTKPTTPAQSNGQIFADFIQNQLQG
jgi:hypothetical protein